MRRFSLFVILGSILFFWAGGCWSVWAQGVVINEFSALSSPDWVELYNQGEETVDLNGWVIRDETQSNKIDLVGLICPSSFRKFDFSNRLNNGGDEIWLIDDSGSEIDRVIYFSQTIPAHLADQSTGRDPDGADLWQVFVLSSPQDEVCFFPTPTSTLTPTLTPLLTPSPIIVTPTLMPTALPTPIPTPTLTPLHTPTPAPQAVDYDHIFLNEVMANPSEGPEWVELYNGNDFPVNLENWFLDDLADSGSSPKKFSLMIGPYDYGVVNLGKNIFNNTGDEVYLLNFAGEEKDHFSFSETTVGQSWGKDGDGNWCLQEPTPQKANPACVSFNQTPTPTLIIKNEPTIREDQEKGEVLGQMGQRYRISQTDSLALKTYLISEESSKPKLKKQHSSLPQESWLPDWLLLSGGLLNFGVGIIRVLKKITF